MGAFTKRVIFADLLAERAEEVEAVIDTDSRECVIPNRWPSGLD